MNEAEFRSLGDELRNWGRWGESDERGTLNLITEAQRIRAASLVRTGKIFDLGIPMDQDGPQTGSPRTNPQRLMLETGVDLPLPGPVRVADDFVMMPLQAATQWDALGHVYYDGLLYNGHPASSIDVHGLHRNSIDRLRTDVCGRGVLLDVAALHNVDSLEAGTPVGYDDLQAATERQGVDIGAGDVLLVRTGWWGRYARSRSRAEFMGAEPGLSMSACRWLRERDVAAVACDNWALEVLPGEVEGVVFSVHMVLLRDMGLTLGELFDLEELAADCAQDGVYEFLLSAPALKFTRGAGTPINPLALK